MVIRKTKSQRHISTRHYNFHHDSIPYDFKHGQRNCRPYPDVKPAQESHFAKKNLSIARKRLKQPPAFHERVQADFVATWPLRWNRIAQGSDEDLGHLCARKWSKTVMCSMI